VVCLNSRSTNIANPSWCLWFLDYFATDKLNIEQASRVIAGIAEGCVQSGAALLGGETAEMPGMYHAGDYDLAGFAVGIVEKDQIIDGTSVAPGDRIIGIASSGPHSNGYSLIRKVIEQHDINAPFNELSLGQTLMLPTRIYVKSILSVLKLKTPVKAMAHITGGGISENVPRSLPNNVTARIDLNQWQAPPIFDWLQQQGGIDEAEMLRTFNCGIGFTLVVNENGVDEVLEALKTAGEQASVIGLIEASEGEPVVSYA